MPSGDEQTLVKLAVNSNGPTVKRSQQYRRLPIAKRIALLERWHESLSIELADLEDQYYAEG
jgi:hypothetical protein